MKPAGKELEFGPFRYDPGQHVLFREGEIVPLPPKAVDTLHALLDRRGRVVDKDELMKLVWPDTTVEGAQHLLAAQGAGSGSPRRLESGCGKAADFEANQN